MRPVADRSSRYAYIFVSLNLVLLLVFFVSSSMNLREVEATRGAYDRLVRDWLSLRLAVTGDASPDGSPEELERFAERVANVFRSDLLASAAMLSEPLHRAEVLASEEWDRLYPALQRYVDAQDAPPVGRFVPSGPREALVESIASFQAALLDLEPPVDRFVSLQQRAFTILLYFLGATIVAAIGIFVLVERENEQRRRAAVDVQSLARRAMGGLERERARIARALHDSLGQELSLALMESQELAVDGAREVADRLKRRLRDSIEWIRDLAHELHPAEIDADGLAAALEAYCRETAAATEVGIEWHVATGIEEPERGVAINVYRIAQEAVTNALRHAGPRRVTLRLRPIEEGLELSVDDDGRGFRTGGVNGSARTGIGLIGIRERAAMLGADLSIESEPGRGTRVRLVVPAGRAVIAEGA